jgi:hypothetical protein
MRMKSFRRRPFFIVHFIIFKSFAARQIISATMASKIPSKPEAL